MLAAFILLLLGLVLQGYLHFREPGDGSDLDDARIENAATSAASAPVSPHVDAPAAPETTGAGAPTNVRTWVQRIEGTTQPEDVQSVLRELELEGGDLAVRALQAIASARQELLTDVAVRLSRLRQREAAPALVEVFEAEDGRGPLAVAALRALGATRLRQHVDLHLRVALDTTAEVAVREAAIEALGLIADPVARDTLRNLQDDTNPRLRRRALRSLGRIPGPETERILEAVQQDAEREQERMLAEDLLKGLRGQGRLRAR